MTHAGKRQRHRQTLTKHARNKGSLFLTPVGSSTIVGLAQKNISTLYLPGRELSVITKAEALG